MSRPRNTKSLVHAFLVLVLTAGQLVAASASNAQPSSAAPVSDQLAHDLTVLDLDAPYGAFVHFEGGSFSDHRALLADHDLRMTNTFPSINVAFAVGTLGAVESLRSEPSISYLEADRKLTYLGDTGPWASRARVAQERVAGGPYRDAGGQILDGTGVGVAIVDSGIDGAHLDLINRLERNFKVVCTTPFLINVNTQQCAGPVVAAELPTTDHTGGHGTHVAGIVAGDGTASQGTYKGVAPGASLYGYGAGEAIFLLTAAEAFQHILDNNDSFSPRIKVVNNSWGDPAGTAYDPDSVLSQLTRALVADGITVVFAAGNDGGNGNADETSSTAKDPTPGVITAANYDDDDSGTRDNVLNTTSSRGRNGIPATYPDISAPGTFITSPCNMLLPVCATGPNVTWAPFYSNLSGTSMAAPHIAGVAALIYQARPELTPAQVEDAILDNAYKFTAGAPYVSDPQNSGGTTSFDKGAGLVDVPRTLSALGVAHDAPLVGSQQIVTGDAGDYVGQGAADIVGLSVQGESTGLRYTLEVRDVDDVGPTTIPVRVTQNVNGRPFFTSLTLSSTGVTIPASSTTNTAPATQATRDVATNTVTFLVPFSNLGNPPAGSPAHNVFVSSFVGLIVDVAPGGLGAEALARPRHGTPYTVQAN